MTEWTTHTPAFDGDGPEGVTLDTHYAECRALFSHTAVAKWGADISGHWSARYEYRYRPRAGIYAINADGSIGEKVADNPPPATYAQVKAWLEQHGHPVPPKPVDYDAWRPVLVELGWLLTDLGDASNMECVEKAIAAMRVAMTIPACMEDVKG